MFCFQQIYGPCVWLVPVRQTENLKVVVRFHEGPLCRIRIFIMELTHPISYRTAITLSLFTDIWPANLWSEDFYEFGDTTPYSECCNFDLPFCARHERLLAPDVIDLRNYLANRYGLFVQYVVSPKNLKRFSFEIVDRKDGQHLSNSRQFPNYFKCLDARLNEALKHIFTIRLNKNAKNEIRNRIMFIRQTIEQSIIADEEELRKLIDSENEKKTEPRLSVFMKKNRIKRLERGRAMSLGKYTYYVRYNDGWFVAQCSQLPAAITQGRSLAEIEVNMKDAIALVLK